MSNANTTTLKRDPFNRWLPGPQVKTHNGEPIANNMEFFDLPPPSIGEVLSADTTLQFGESPMSSILRVGMATGLFTGLLAVGIYLRDDPVSRRELHLVWIAGIAGAALAGVILLITRFRHAVTYVGRNGVHRSILSGNRVSASGRKTLLFGDATVLYRSCIAHYHKGIYAGTEYDYKWLDKVGKILFRAKGQHYNRKGRPIKKNLFHFAEAAEQQWTRHLYPIALAQLKQTGSILFPQKWGRTITVTPNSIEEKGRRKTVHFPLTNVASIQMENGLLVVQSQDAKWYSGKGKWKLDTQFAGNVLLMIQVLQELTGAQSVPEEPQ